jgi:hypothetical protein
MRLRATNMVNLDPVAGLSGRTYGWTYAPADTNRAVAKISSSM